eukprot:jgi/Mesvir1/13363/Mv06223-RA.1
MLQQQREIRYGPCTCDPSSIDWYMATPTGATGTYPAACVGYLAMKGRLYEPLMEATRRWEAPSSALGSAGGGCKQLIQVLKMEPPIVVSPSMSGSYSLPFIAKYPTQAAGYVPVAPVGVAMYQSMLEGSQVPTMVLWGELDNPRRADSLAHLFKEADVVCTARRSP